MESICEYCKDSFIPKRTDALYCSHSCRQLAYVLRKTKVYGSLGVTPYQIDSKTSKEPSISEAVIKNDPSSLSDGEKKASSDLTDKTDEPSTKIEEAAAYPSTISQTSVNSESGLSVNKDNVDASLDTKAINSVIKPVQEQEKYQDYSSPLLDEIVELTQARDNLGILYSFLHNKTQGPAYWVSLRYRCLVECLLTFSEMQSIELDDLKEVCNAFTSLLQSRFYNYMIPEYPYLRDIPWLRDTIKNICLNAEEETLTFRLKKETKLKLIAARWELANYVPKVGFDQLNFNQEEK